MERCSIARALGDAHAVIDRVDARVLLCHVIQRDAAFLIAHPEAPLAPDQLARYETLVARRAAGEPVAYLTGAREFLSRVFRVTPAVLIPRPETECLVERALERLAPGARAAVADLGTGSGCIAVSVALERPNAVVVGVDRSAEALRVASENASRLGAATVRFVQSDWFSSLAGEAFDLIVSNPPYVAAGDTHLEQGDLRYEPHEALEAGSDGLSAIRHIVEVAPRYLKPGGALLLEHGFDQAQPVRALLQGAGFGEVFSATDLAGIERVSGGVFDVSQNRS